MSDVIRPESFSPSHKTFDFVPTFRANYSSEESTLWAKRLDSLALNIIDEKMVNKFYVCSAFKNNDWPSVALAQMAYIVALSPSSHEQMSRLACEHFAHHIVQAVKSNNDPVQNKNYTAYALFHIAENGYRNIGSPMSRKRAELQMSARSVASRVYLGFSDTDVCRAFADNEVSILEHLCMMRPAGGLYSSFARIAEKMLDATPDVSNPENAEQVADHLTRLLCTIKNTSYESGNKIGTLLDVWGKGYDLLTQVNPEQARIVVRATMDDPCYIVHPKLWQLASQRYTSNPLCTHPSCIKRPHTAPQGTQP